MMQLFKTETRALLNAAECEDFTASVMADRAHWSRRHASLPFYTLGAASYLDAGEARERYLTLARQTNPLLRARFGGLLDRVADHIAAHLGQETLFHPAAALPGFHIYLAHELFSLPVASIHFDLQYRHIDWQPLGECDFSTPLSFTLPLALPASGSGLTVWPIEYEECEDLSPTALHRRQQGVVAETHRYAAGQMLLHSGHRLHQAAPCPAMTSGECRLTLQGHGLKAGGKIYLYW